MSSVFGILTFKILPIFPLFQCRSLKNIITMIIIDLIKLKNLHTT